MIILVVKYFFLKKKTSLLVPSTSWPPPNDLIPPSSKDVLDYVMNASCWIAEYFLGCFSLADYLEKTFCLERRPRGAANMSGTAWRYDFPSLWAYVYQWLLYSIFNTLWFPPLGSNLLSYFQCNHFAIGSLKTDVILPARLAPDDTVSCWRPVAFHCLEVNIFITLSWGRCSWKFLGVSEMRAQSS